MLQAEEWHFDCLTVIGGGVIGVELAAIFAALGSKVTILERSSCLLSDMDPAASEQLEDSLRGRGIDVRCNVDVMQITERSNDTVSVCFQEQGSWKEVPADRVLVAAGRTSYLGNVLAEDCEVTVKNGSPVVKGAYRTCLLYTSRCV